jgi:hypothetical protein
MLYFKYQNNLKTFFNFFDKRFMVGERKYLIGEKCDDCGINQKTNSNLCQNCYNKRRYIKPLDKVGICRLCENLKYIFSISNGLCKSCYHNKRYIETKKKLIEDGHNIRTYETEKLPNCKTCGESFSIVKRCAKNLCTSCYNKSTKAIRSDKCSRCKCQLDKFRIRNICDHCRVKKGKTEKIEKPDLQQISTMKLLITKSKWNLLDEIDYFRIIDLYLQVVGHDEKLNKFSDIGTIQFCIKRFREWCKLY